MIFLPRQTCAICALSISLAVGCSPASPEALATYDGGEVTRSRLDGLFLTLPEDRRQPPAGQSLDQWLEELLFNIALEETLISRARASGVDDDQSLRLQARVQASRQVGAEYAKNRCSDFDVGDAEVEAVYEQQFAGRPRSWVLLRHIFKRVPGDAAVETKSALRFEMETLLRQLEEGASFIDLAREHSDSATAAEGGLIGRVSRAAPMDKAVLDAGWSLEDGQHSAIVEVSTGFHIVFRETSGVEEPVDLDDSREKIRPARRRPARKLWSRAAGRPRRRSQSRDQPGGGAFGLR